MKALSVSGSIFMAALLSTGGAFAQSSGSSKSGTIHPDASGKSVGVGGSQSERTGESGVPLPKGSPQSGTVDIGKSSAGATESSTGMRGNTGNIRAVQQALKDKGYDPGPVDGVVGSRTKEAIKSFQTASNIRPSGSLNAETVEKLGVQSDSQSSSRSSSGSMGSREKMKSSDTTVGKDTDQPNQPASKNR